MTYDSKERLTGMCTLCLKQSADADWHVGTSLLMDYYAEFDYEAKALSLTGLLLGDKK